MTDMIEQTAGRNGHDVILQVLQVMDADHFFHGVRIAEDKVAKAKKTLDKSTQVNGHFLRVLVDKVCMTFISQLGFLRLGGVQNKWYIGVVGSDGTKQFVTGIFVFFRIWHQRETAVADNA